MTSTLAAYLPIDRRLALSRGERLPDRSQGTAQFVDLSGFTALTEALTQQLGPLQGAEELSRHLGRLFSALIEQVHRFQGSVIGFSGDAITCWFAADDGLRATAAALSMQEAMARLEQVVLPGGEEVRLAIKVAMVAGPVRRFLVGNPDVQVMDVLAGRTTERLAAAEQLARRAEVVADDSIAGLGSRIVVSDWRHDQRQGGRVALVDGLAEPVPESTWAPLADGALPEDAVRPWLLPSVYARLKHGMGEFLADFRPAAALFLSFRGIDYDEDEAAGEKLDRFVTWAQAVIARYEGTLVQLTIGDKGSYLYAAFGAPVAHADDPARAVGAALDLQRPPSQLDFVHDLKIGLTHGQMYAGAYGSQARSTYGVLGSKTNLAARLMSAAACGEILCDQEIYRLAGRSWAFSILPGITVKGRPEPVAVFTPTGEAPHRGQAESRGQAVQRLVGRETDLGRLKASLDRLQAGSGRVSLLEGEAGIGKSRLVLELIDLARARAARVHVGVAQSVAQQTPYRAWREVLTSCFDLNDISDEEERRSQAARSVQAAAPDLIRYLPLLNDVLNLGLAESDLTLALDSNQRQENLVRLILQLLRFEASQGPLIVVLEDAHWLDSLSWDLAERAARTLLAEGAAFWLMLVSRPLEAGHLGGRAAGGLQKLPDCETIELSPLGDSELIRLAAQRLELTPDELPDAIAKLVVERSNGNPFIAEELVKTLLDQGLIEIKRVAGERHCLVSEGFEENEMRLPDTLQGLILARFDRLHAEQQLILKVASAIGRTFSSTPLRDTLKRVNARSRTAPPQKMRELIRREFIHVEGDQAELSYAFRHIITHDVVYQTLLFSQRRQLHQALGEWYEQRYGERLSEVYSTLAHHYSVAAEGAGDDALLEKAVGYLSKDSRQLANLGAFPEAIGALRQALSLLPDQPDRYAQRAAVLVQLGGIHEKVGSYAEATDALQAGLSLAERAAATATAVEALTHLCTVSTRQGNFPEALAAGERARQLAVSSDDKLGLAGARSNLGIVAAYQGAYQEAIEHFEAGLEIYRQLEDLERSSVCLNSLGLVAVYQREYERAIRQFNEALRISRVKGDRNAIGKILTNMGLVAEKLGDLAGAAKHYQESLEILREIGARQAAVINVLNLASVAAERSDDETSWRYHQEALSEAMALGALPIAIDSLIGIARLYARTGRAEHAAQLLGLALSHPASDAEVRQNAEPLLADLSATLGDEGLASAMARGRSMRFDDVTKDVLSEGAHRAA